MTGFFSEVFCCSSWLSLQRDVMQVLTNILLQLTTVVAKFLNAGRSFFP
jgi:hypothetical protein